MTEQKFNPDGLRPADYVGEPDPRTLMRMEPQISRPRRSGSSRLSAKLSTSFLKPRSKPPKSGLGTAVSDRYRFRITQGRLRSTHRSMASDLTDVYASLLVLPEGP